MNIHDLLLPSVLEISVPLSYLPPDVDSVNFGVYFQVIVKLLGEGRTGK